MTGKKGLGRSLARHAPCGDDLSLFHGHVPSEGNLGAPGSLGLQRLAGERDVGVSLEAVEPLVEGLGEVDPEEGVVLRRSTNVEIP